MNTVTHTIHYSNSPAFGAQYATIETTEEGTTAIYIHFNEKQYDGSSKTLAHYVWTAGERHTAADILQAAKNFLGKHASRSGYYGPMEFTITEPALVAEALVVDYPKAINENRRQRKVATTWQERERLDKEVAALRQQFEAVRVTCEKAPVGWRCSRTLGHPGPCAAHKVHVKHEYAT